MTWGFSSRLLMLVIAALAIVGAVFAAVTIRHDAADGEVARDAPHAVAGAVPGGSPYAQLAVLRRQRMSTDVLPTGALANESGATPHIVATSARLVDRHGDDEYFVAVDEKGEVCLLDTTIGSAGYNSLCTTGAPRAMPSGSGLLGGGFGDYEFFRVVTDGTPRAGVLPADATKLTTNVWRLKHP